MASDIVKFAVISDPHALVGDEYRHETAAWKQTAGDPARNPFAAVRKLIEDSRKEDAEGEPLTADALLCPGDLAHRMNEAGLAYAWEELEATAGLLEAEQIIATAGNHDVIRKEDLPADAEAGAWVKPLRALLPPFPSHCSEAQDAYFNDDFIVATGERWRVVALNSCAFHAEKHEYRHGKVDASTVKHLRRRIEAENKVEKKDVNVLMCHHHPVEWTHLSQADTSHMRGGDYLLRELEEVDPTAWLVLHGHRHTAALGYAGDGNNGPTRMSVGSLAISLPHEGRTDKRNQFYMLEFDLEEISRLGLTGAGRFRAWDWNWEEGMTPSSPVSALPGRGGFGFRRNAYELAKMCEETAADLSRRSVTMAELVEADQRWAYVAPRDLQMLRTVLEGRAASVDPAGGGSHIETVGLNA